MGEERTAGYNCNGGTLDGGDSHDGTTTKESCEEGGGVWASYTCGDSQWWLNNEADVDAGTMSYLIDTMWGPACCETPVGFSFVVDNNNEDEENDNNEEEEEKKSHDHESHDEEESHDHDKEPQTIVDDSAATSC